MCYICESNQTDKRNIMEKLAENTIPNEIIIGMQFIRRGRRNKYIETVVDIYKTYNSKGELVKTTYVAEHEFLGQIVTDSEVPASTIKMGYIGLS
jgi:hypothetical protein